MELEVGVPRSFTVPSMKRQKELVEEIDLPPAVRLTREKAQVRQF